MRAKVNPALGAGRVADVNASRAQIGHDEIFLMVTTAEQSQDSTWEFLDHGPAE